MVTKRAPIALVLIIVAIVGTISFVSLASQSGRTEPSSTSASEGNHSVTFYSAVSPVGLQLQFELNTTVIQQGGALKAQAYLYNTLSQNLSLTPDFSANPNIATWDSYDSPCGFSPVFDVFGFALYQGHLTPANLSQAGTPFPLSPQFYLPCGPPPREPMPGHPGSFWFGGPKKIEFAQESHLATLSTNSPPNASTLGDMQLDAGTWMLHHYIITRTATIDSFNLTEAALYGYWSYGGMGEGVCPLSALMSNANNTTTESLVELYCNPHPFSVGSYTLVAEDLWNDTDYAYFQVVPTIQTNTSSQVMMTMPVRYVLLIALAVTIAVTAAIVARSEIRRSPPQQNRDGSPDSH